MFGNDDSQRAQFCRLANNMFQRGIADIQYVSTGSITRSELLNNCDLQPIVFAG